MRFVKPRLSFGQIGRIPASALLAFLIGAVVSINSILPTLKPPGT